MSNNTYELIVVGSGAAGMIAAIKASRDNKKVLLLEKLLKIGSKLKATGGGRCNLSNSLENTEFMNSFGRNGRFMTTALNLLDHKELIKFFNKIGVETHSPDGFRIFPKTHNASTIIDALEKELKRLGVDIVCDEKVEKLITEDDKIVAVETTKHRYKTSNLILATGGLGYPKLGSTGDGYKLSSDIGHKITTLHPAMMPLLTKQSWQNSCRADTIPKAQIKIDLPKAKKLKATGDLIFTSNGLRGPVVLDFAREITPFLDKYKEVPILINMVKGKNEEEVFQYLKKQSVSNPDSSIIEQLSGLLPNSVAIELCKIVGANSELKFNKLDGTTRDSLIKIIVNTPFTITGHDGFKMAMITRGGVSLKEIEPKTMQSKLIDGLYFCGEIMDLDGPCGGYNLQWSFSSGYLAGSLLK
ncbi:MAG: NAD(P)/FAD-dependent oxidoreductase [Campylobacterota bacterium]|nr:NAD(P)/FAD-dependent oxidoreductase [Campylobacterota bacterium]